MNKYLESAVERYLTLTDNKECFIHPISKTDTEIIERLIALVNSKEVVSIMGEYKFEKDSNILEKLNKVKVGDLFQKLTEAVSEAEPDKPEPKFDVMEINKEIFKLKEIYGVKCIDESIYDKDSGNVLEKFSIVLNPLPELELSKIPLYADYKLLFDYEEDRDATYAFIKDIIDKNYNLTKL